MELGFVISISCLIGAVALGISLAFHNQKRLRETHDIRMRIYRERKRRKNEALRRFYGLEGRGDTAGEPAAIRAPADSLQARYPTHV
jgi:hypothetical protein